MGYSLSATGDGNRLYGADVTAEGNDNVTKLDLTPRTFLFFALAIVFGFLFPVWASLGLVGVAVFSSKSDDGKRHRLHHVLAVIVGSFFKFVLRIALFSFLLPLASLVGIAWYLTRDPQAVGGEMGSDDDDDEDIHADEVIPVDDGEDDDVHYPHIDDPFPDVPERDEVEEDEHFLLCPISHEIMTDPVTVVDSGHTYDRRNILSWWHRNDTDPMTNLPVRKALVENKLIKQMVYARLARQ